MRFAKARRLRFLDECAHATHQPRMDVPGLPRSRTARPPGSGGAQLGPNPRVEIGWVSNAVVLEDLDGDAIREVCTGWPDMYVQRCGGGVLVVHHGETGGFAQVSAVGGGRPSGRARGSSPGTRSAGSSRARPGQGNWSAGFRSFASVTLLPGALNHAVFGKSGLLVATRARQW